ncbi:hypothetical protein [Nocardia sp. NPDC051832]|uniref:hypothetical protein n=1 Tax=Nocardia sp. NPDC051832 TaxID=3155673 RepID=UPI00343F9FAE
MTPPLPAPSPSPPPPPPPAGPTPSSGTTNNWGDWKILLLVAVIGAVAALGGAFCGGYFTYQAAIRQSESSSSQALDSFKRDQRKVAYAEFLSESINLENAEFVLQVQALSFPTQQDRTVYGAAITRV